MVLGMKEGQSVGHWDICLIWTSLPLGASVFHKHICFTGFDDKELHHLADPVCPCIFFAGEHTDVENLSTALGAYNSGVRAAEQVISGFCDKKMEEKKSAKDKGSESKETKGDEQQINKAKDELWCQSIHKLNIRIDLINTSTHSQWWEAAFLCPPPFEKGRAYCLFRC